MVRDDYRLHEVIEKRQYGSVEARAVMQNMLQRHDATKKAATEKFRATMRERERRAERKP